LNRDTTNEFCLKNSSVFEPSALKAGENISLRGVTQYISIVGKEGPAYRNHSNSPSVRTKSLEFEEKVAKVKHILNTTGFYQCAIFCNQRTKAETLATILEDNGWPTGFIAGDLPQSLRNNIMEKVRKFEIRVLVSTDLTARGVDLDRINLVLCLDVPRDAETYMHRVGRTGRFGSYGVAVSILSTSESGRLYSLLRKAFPTLMGKNKNKSQNNNKINQTDSNVEDGNKERKDGTMLKPLPEVIPTLCYANNISEDDQKRLGELEAHRLNQDCGDDTKDINIPETEASSERLEIELKQGQDEKCFEFEYDGTDNKYRKWLREASACVTFRVGHIHFPSNTAAVGSSFLLGSTANVDENVEVIHTEKETEKETETETGHGINNNANNNSNNWAKPNPTVADSMSYAEQYSAWIFNCSSEIKRGDNYSFDNDLQGPPRPWLIQNSNTIK